MKLGDFLKSINDTKENVIVDDKSEKLYTPFVVNRCLSYFTDTILYSNQMNMNSHIDNKLQYEYYLNSIRKRKRFSRWLKSENPDDLEFIKEHFNYSNKKAKEAISVLGADGIRDLKNRYSKGG
tara:strand:- start:1902 stop:2273 length:372 start_codon:yes stop_codon:yes gene_type:complete